MSKQLIEYIPNQVWLNTYPVHYAGLDFTARMTIIRVENGSIIIHSPGPITPSLQDAILNLGQVSAIIAPGSYHYLVSA